MSMRRYPLGSAVPVSVTFRVGISPQEPSAWFVRVRPPSGDEYTVASDDPAISGSDGAYTWLLSTAWNDASQRGIWGVRGISTEGATQSVSPWVFFEVTE